MVLFILSEIIDLRNQEKKRKKQKISVLIEFHPSLTKKPKPAHTCYLSSLYPCSRCIIVTLWSKYTSGLSTERTIGGPFRCIL